MMHRLTATLMTGAIAIALSLAGTATASAAQPSQVPSQSDPSPSGCRIVFVDNPHFARSVPGAVKVNAKAECNVPVPEQDLSVTLLVDGKPLVKTIENAKDKTFVQNQKTFIQCKNTTERHMFQGAALGTSYEDNKPYLQTRQGNAVELACGI